MTAPRDLDDLASAYLDGELTGDEATRAAADPDVVARADGMRQARDQMRDVPPAPDTGRASAVAAALDAFPGAPVVPSAPPPAGSAQAGANGGTGARRRRGPLLAVAASAVALALAVGVISLTGGDDDDTLASSAPESADQAEDPQADAPETAEDRAGAAPAPMEDAAEPEAFDAEEDGAVDHGSAADGTADAPVPHLGTAADTAALRQLVATALDEGAAGAPGSGAPVDPGSCEAWQLGGDPDRGVARFSATAQLGGVDVWVHVYRDEQGDRLVATDRSCVDHVDDPL